MSSGGSDPACCGFFLLIAGGTSLAAGISTYWKKKQIENTPTSKVRAVALGQTELSGKAVGALAKSPLLGKDCVYYRLEAYETVKQGKHSNTYLRFTENSGTPVFLEDDTGKIELKLGEAELHFAPDLDQMIYSIKASRPELLPKCEELLKAHNYAPKNPDFLMLKGDYRKYTFKEYFLEPGDPLYVMGAAMRIKGAASDIGHENLYIGKGSKDAIFYVADKTESAVLKEMGGWMLATGLGILGILAGLLIIFARFGML